MDVIELFAGVGGFRIGFEMANKQLGKPGFFKTIWSNQWEPSTKRQDASIIYRNRFGEEGHVNKDINNVKTSEIPDCDILAAGFPCQNFSIAASLKNSKGIEGEKGVLWWQIHRIIMEMENKPGILLLENVDRLLISPAKQRGRDFAIILASLNDLGYTVEWMVINAADYGMPQRRKRTFIMAYNKETTESIRKVLLNAFTITKADPMREDRFEIKGDLHDISENFNKCQEKHHFYSYGIADRRFVTTFKHVAVYDGPQKTLGDILIDESEVPDEYFIPDDELEKWKYLKGAKKNSAVSTKKPAMNTPTAKVQ